jgi:hypothetical protein
MKDFVRSAGRLRALPLPARVTYSVFLGFTLLALAESAWLGSDMLGAKLQRVDEYYAGVAEPPAAGGHAQRETSGNTGPSLELPSELLVPQDSPPIPLRKLLEVTHFHLFSMPVYLMILSHLFMLSSWGARTKVLWITLGSVGVAAHIAAPWLSRAQGVASTLFYATSGALLAAAFLVMSGVPLFEMWRPRRNDFARPGAE